MEWEENLDEIFDLKHILPEIYSSHPFPNHTNKTCDDNIIKKANTKQLLNSISPKLISSSSSCPKLISFENSKTFDVSPNSETAPNCNSNLGHHEMANKDNYSLAPQIINFASAAKNNDDFGNNQNPDATNEILSNKRGYTATRTQLQARDHLLAERKRRENLGQLFISLSKIVPGLKKLDKASLLEDAINHLKVLRERVNILEQEMKNKKTSSNNKEDYSSCKESPNNNIDHNNNNMIINGSTCESGGAEIKARISNKHVLIKIQCKKQKGLMSRVPCQMEKMHLSVLDMRVIPFGGAALDITVLAEMQSEFRGSVKDIVDHLHVIFFNPRDNLQDDLIIIP